MLRSCEALNRVVALHNYLRLLVNRFDMTISIACDWVICTCLPLVIGVFCFYLDTFQFRSCFYYISIFLLHFF